MYEHHGWLRTSETSDAKEIEKTIKEINSPYPASAQYVNSNLHVSFSGNPNRNLGQTKEILNYLCSLKLNLSGCIYINDSDTDRYNRYDIIKIINDKTVEIEDKNFSLEETKLIFN
jgi:hypothetical protein